MVLRAVACVVSLCSAAAGAAALSGPNGLVRGVATPQPKDPEPYYPPIFHLYNPSADDIPLNLPPLPDDRDPLPPPSPPQLCAYDTQPGSVGKLLLTVGTIPQTVKFVCPDRGLHPVLPLDATRAFAVDANGECDTQKDVDLIGVLMKPGKRRIEQEDEKGTRYTLVASVGWPVDKDKKLCFVCKASTEQGADKACHVIITLPKVTLPNTRKCNPANPPNENMMAFKADESDKTVTLHCPKGYTPRFSPDKDDYFATGSDCHSKKKLVDILGPGAVFQQLPEDPGAGNSRGYRISISNLPPTPRILCLDCTRLNSEVRQDGPNTCQAIVFAPAGTRRNNEDSNEEHSDESGNQSPTASSAIPAGLPALQFVVAATCVSMIPAFASLVL